MCIARIELASMADLEVGEDDGCDDNSAFSYGWFLFAYWCFILILIPSGLLYWYRLRPHLKESDGRVANMLRTLGTWRGSSRSGSAVRFEEGSAQSAGPRTISESRDLVIAGTVIMTLGGCWGFAVG